MEDLGRKLQLKQNSSILLLNAPTGAGQALAGSGYTVTDAIEVPSVGTYDAVQLFARSRQELEALAPQAIALLKPGALLWIAYPKKTSGIISDLTRDEGWKILDELGYGAVRQVALDDTWSSLRFKHESERKEPSQFGVDPPGIDRATKTVVPPADMQQALEAAGVAAVFWQLAFTHRKEYVVAVLDAKRPETRAKRIAKTVEELKARAAKEV
ncbi:YdeI/OmpD-associated family protein [Pontibacter liquoris]|uniref:YdeI/OmpD-associated family protein n=1 Tax=Pontibacter liquoris TaxID=2905677 RepID=UPI001FA70A11|nr:YdeI/OmpD-associated family protein [Pontibacter liquoris]